MPDAHRDWMLGEWRRGSLPRWEAILMESERRGPDYPWSQEGQRRIDFARQMVDELMSGMGLAPQKVVG